VSIHEAALLNAHSKGNDHRKEAKDIRSRDSFCP
jgi:hypothetical protein